VNRLSSGTLPDTTALYLFSEEYMGGKRPDQYRIDPSEGQSTDNKWGPGHSDENIKNEQKARVELSGEPHQEPRIPESGMNPALRELREVKMETKREQEQSGAHDDPDKE
jgi:hypothetical protein